MLNNYIILPGDREVEYYEAFDAFYRDNNNGAMINFIAEYVDRQLDEYLNMV